MPRTEDTLETVDLLYRAAVDTQLWPEALEKFAQSIGCIGMAMIPITPNETTGLIVSPSMREVEVEYHQGWSQYDSRVRRIFTRQLSRGVFCEAHLFEDDELARDPFRQEFCRKFGIGAFAVQLIEPWPGHVVAFSGQRALKRGHFEGTEVDSLNWLGRHAARALTISLRLAAGERTVGGLLEILERFNGGVFVLNARCEVSTMNARAERMLGDGLTVARHRLLAGAADRQQRLDLLLASALDDPSGTGLKPIALPRPSGKKPLMVQAIPLRSRRSLDGLQLGFGLMGALVLVVDPESTAAPPHDGLRLLGLTAAESRLAALVGSGLRRRDAANILDISEWTARDSLKHIYSKLDIRTQGELVRIVDRIAAIEPPRQLPD